MHTKHTVTKSKSASEFINKTLNSVINNTSNKLPIAIAKIACQYFMSEKHATALLVHTPASGNGIATKNTSVKKLIALFLLCKLLLVFCLSLDALFLKNTSKCVAIFLNNLVVFKYFIIGFKNNNIKKAGNIEPIKDTNALLNGLSAALPHISLDIPKGIATLASAIGSMATKNTATQVTLPKLCLKNSNISLKNTYLIFRITYFIIGIKTFYYYKYTIITHYKLKKIVKF